MLTREQILQGVQEVIGAEVGVKNPALLTANTRLHDDLGAKSLCLLNVWCALEARFGVSFSMVEMFTHGGRDGLTIGDLVEAVAAKAPQLQPSPVPA